MIIGIGRIMQVANIFKWVPIVVGMRFEKKGINALTRVSLLK